VHLVVIDVYKETVEIEDHHTNRKISILSQSEYLLQLGKKVSIQKKVMIVMCP